MGREEGGLDLKRSLLTYVRATPAQGILNILVVMMISRGLYGGDFEVTKREREEWKIFTDIFFVYRSRKRRPSSGNIFQTMMPLQAGDDVMDECAAAMVLMSLSCSPHSPQWENNGKIKVEKLKFFGPNFRFGLLCGRVTFLVSHHNK